MPSDPTSKDLGDATDLKSLSASRATTVQALENTNSQDFLSGVGAVVIGRNEGARLDACLGTLKKLAPRLVYVDSGSTDNSLEIARRHSAHTIELDMSVPFTAARARNVGWRALLEKWSDLWAVQFLDGDCEVIDGWLEAGAIALEANTALAAVCGQRKERFPDASVYNLMCDIEWNTPVGPARAVGGDALFRTSALQAVDGYDDNFIAGEEPEMCVRMRSKGWQIERLDHAMTWHDAAIMHFGQHWKRSVRGGYAYALGASKHGAAPEKHNVRQVRSALSWGLVLPMLAVIATLMLPYGWLLWLSYPLQVARLSLKLRPPRPLLQAFFLTVGKFSETLGILQWHRDKHLGRQAEIIEYKGP